MTQPESKTQMSFKGVSCESQIQFVLEMIHFTGDIYENIKPQLLLQFSLSNMPKKDFGKLRPASNFK